MLSHNQHSINLNYFKMNAIKQYRVKLLMTEISHEFSTINQVNEWIDNDMLKRNQSRMGQIETYNQIGFIFATPSSYMVESYDWDKLEFLPSHFGILQNKMCN